MGIGKRIKEARLNLSLTQEDLARLLGVTKGAVANYENETSHPKEPVMYKLIEVLKVDANYLFQDVVNIPKKVNDVTFAEYEHIKKYRGLDAHGKDMVDIVLDREHSRSISIKETLPQEETNLIDFPVSPYKASAGSGYLLFDAEPDEIWSVVSNSETRKADIGITVSGDSMEPLYCDGDVLLVRKQPDIEIGEIGIFIKDGQGYVKKKGEDRLISLNKSRPDIYPSEFGEILCFGKVIGKLKPEWIAQK